MPLLTYRSDLDDQRYLDFPVLETFKNGGSEVLVAVPSADYEEDGREMHLVLNTVSRSVHLVKDESLLGEKDKHRILVGTDFTIAP